MSQKILKEVQLNIPASHYILVALLDQEADTPLAGRSREQIIARALDRAAEAASLKLEPNVADAIAKLLDISAPADQALTEIRALLKTAGIKLDAQLAAMDARMATLKSLGVEPGQVQFAAHFGRNMEYAAANVHLAPESPLNWQLATYPDHLGIAYHARY